MIQSLLFIGVGFFGVRRWYNLKKKGDNSPVALILGIFPLIVGLFLLIGYIFPDFKLKE